MCLAKGTVNGRDMSIGAVHLKAGLASSFGFIRSRQVREAIQFQALNKFDDGLLVGDFNFREACLDMPDPADQVPEKSTMIEDAGYMDLWLQTNGHEARYIRQDGQKNSPFLTAFHFAEDSPTTWNGMSWRG